MLYTGTFALTFDYAIILMKQHSFGVELSLSLSMMPPFVICRLKCFVQASLNAGFVKSGSYYSVH